MARQATATAAVAGAISNMLVATAAAAAVFAVNFFNYQAHKLACALPLGELTPAAHTNFGEYRKSFGGYRSIK
jgi:hypothetical protein